MEESQDKPLPYRSEPFSGEAHVTDEPSAETMGLLSQLASGGKSADPAPEAQPEATDPAPAEEPQGEPSADPAPAPDDDGTPPAADDPAPGPADPAPPVEDTRMAELLSRGKAVEDNIRQQREALATDRERVERFQERLGNWPRNRVEVLRSLAQEAIGEDDPEKVEAELKGLYEDLTARFLGVDSDDPAKREVAQMRAELDRIQRDKAAAEKKKADEAAAAARAANREATVRQFGEMLDEQKDEYPFLLAEDNPGETLFGVAQYLIEHGAEMTLQEAALYANEQLKKRAERYRSLLLGTETQTQQSPPQPAQSRDQQPGPATLTNRQAAAEAPPPKLPAPDDEFIEDEHAAIEATLAKVGKLRQQQTGS